MKLIDDSPEELPPLVELGPPGQYRTPPAVQALGVVAASRKGLARIRLALEGGYELDIPTTQEAIDALFDVLRELARPRR